MTHAAPCIACLLGQLLRSRVLLRRSGGGGGRPRQCDMCNSLHRMNGGHANALTHRDPYPSGFGGRSGEVVEDVAPPLPLATPLLLVKPPAGLATPAVFRALDLGGRSAADPRALLAALAGGGSGAA